MIRINNNKQVLKRCVYLLSILLVLVSCQKEMDKYYEKPGWLKGNAWETLESKGNFTIFLTAVEKAGYKELVNGNGIVTVMAPDDAVFQNYLSSKGIASIDAMPVKELSKLIAYHLVYYSFSKNMFVNYQPDGIEADDTGKKGLFYKYRTKSKDDISEAVDSAYSNTIRKIYHKERFLPVFSYELFNTKEIDAKSNYEYFYPSSTWTGGSDGFNISNASVNEFEIITNNGYIYTINQVLEPLETIFTELNNSTNFTDFKNACDRFTFYDLDATATADFGKGSQLYLKYFNGLVQIASEWTFNGTNDFAELGELSSSAYNVFAPNNTSLQAFYKKYWDSYYNSLNDVNIYPMFYFLANHMSRGSVIFPEEIEKGSVKTIFGSTINFNPGSALLKKMCVNGALYGLDHVLEPGMFTSVTGPAFQDPKYNMFLMMMDGAALVEPLMTNQATFKLYLPSDTMITDFTRVRYSSNKVSDIRYINANPKLAGSELLQVMGTEDYVTMTQPLKDGFVRNHVTTTKITQLGNDVIYRTMNPYNYLYFRNDTILSSGIFNNNSKGPTYSLIPGSRTNGETFALAGDVSALVPEYNLFKEVMLRSPKICPPEFEAFRLNVIQKAGLDITLPPFTFLTVDRFIVFIPSNSLQVDLAAITADKAVDYAKYYFVNVAASNLQDYPFPGANISGELTTYKSATGNTMEKLTLIDTGTGLKVRDKMGNEVNIIGVFPRIYEDGAAYLIDGLLKYE